MDTNKEHNPSMPERITSEEVKTLQAYIEELEGLKELPAKLTAEEWKEATTAINNTGIIPDKYKGRIIPEEITLEYDTIQIKDEDGNLILNENGKPQFRQIPINPPKKEIVYHDSADVEYMHRRAFIEGKYHELVIKALRTHKGNAKDIAGIIQELLEDPEIRREFEKEERAAKIAELPALGSMPNSEIVNFLFKLLNQKNGRTVTEAQGNRHEKIEVVDTINENDEPETIYKRINRQQGSEVYVSITYPDAVLKRSNTGFVKLLLFTLQKMTAQNFPLEVGFSLHELVSLGMYANIDAARKAFLEFYQRQIHIEIGGNVKRDGKSPVRQAKGQIYYHYDIDNGYVKLRVNDAINWEFIAGYFTYFPRFAYALKSNSFQLVFYIFARARLKTKKIKQEGSFTISLKTVRETLGLPSVEEVTNRRYNQLIKKPILNAINEIEAALKENPEIKGNFNIKAHTPETKDINKWLEGYLEIKLTGDFAKPFLEFADKKEDKENSAAIPGAIKSK